MSAIGPLRAALRIARRDALRSKGRTTLVVCMIGLPVMVITALTVLMRTADLSPAESLPYDLGRADARIEAFGRTPMRQDLEGRTFGGGGDPSGEGAAGGPWTTEQLARVVAGRFGPGARIIPLGTGGETALKTERGYVTAGVRELDLRDPVTPGILRVTAGRPAGSPDEIAISASLRDRGFRLGESVQVDRSGTRKTVVGYIEDPHAPGDPAIQALPGVFPGGGAPTEWLLAAGRPVSWADVRALNQTGLVVLSREVVLRPPAKSEIPPDVVRDDARSADLAVAALVTAMITLEVVLLAGPAFAVGIGRQRRRLALVAAGGGGRGHLRAIVLGGGLVTGLLAAVLGVVAGLAVAVAAVPVIDRRRDTVLGPFEVPWTWVTATALVGVLSGLAAAYVPARQAARMNVVAALSGRREDGRTRRGRPIVGAILIAIGVVVTALGVYVLQEFGAAIGAIALIVGFVVIVPWVIGRAGRLARWAPLPMRLAVRDADRNRGRTAPVVAAILAAVAAMTTLAIGAASDFAQRRVEYTPRLPAGATAITGLQKETWPSAREQVARELPGVPMIELSELGDTECAMGHTCTRVEVATFGDCSDANPRGCIYGESGFGIAFAVGGASAARFIMGRDDPAVTAAIDAGKVVLFLPEGVRDGSVVLRTIQFTTGQPDVKTLRRVTLPAVRAEAAATAPMALLPPAAARRLEVPITPAALLIAPADHRVTESESGRIEEAVAGITDRAVTYTERGFVESFDVPLLLLAAAASVMVLGGALISTGLSAADARPDLATLAAVGARPRTSRLLMMGQAGFVALLGCALGVLAGLGPGLAVTFPLTSNDGSYGSYAVTDGTIRHGVIIDIPWTLLGAVGLAVPLITALAAGLFTRSRLPAARRIA